MVRQPVQRLHDDDVEHQDRIIGRLTAPDPDAPAPPPTRGETARNQSPWKAVPADRPPPTTTLSRSSVPKKAQRPRHQLPHFRDRQKESNHGRPSYASGFSRCPNARRASSSSTGSASMRAIRYRAAVLQTLQTTGPSKSGYPSTTVTTPSSRRAGNDNFNSLLSCSLSRFRARLSVSARAVGVSCRVRTAGDRI